MELFAIAIVLCMLFVIVGMYLIDKICKPYYCVECGKRVSELEDRYK